MKRGDIYMVSFDPTKGREQRGHRPVLIISPPLVIGNATGVFDARLNDVGEMIRTGRCPRCSRPFVGSNDTM